MRFAFYGRVSTEDQQDPEASRGWQLARARQLVEPAGGEVVTEFFDIGLSRSLPWKRRPEAARLLEAFRDPRRGFDAVVIGEPQRAFYGNQFGLTFPVFEHFGVGLWVPEVGGAIDPGSDAHELVMSLYGGMSKGERQRIKTRVRAAMASQAATQGRFLGGRPPYGYQLADAGPHPNPGKAAAGQRAHRLEVNSATAPIVRRIFDEYLSGRGVFAIAEGLTRDGVPSPSAADPKRNRHRDVNAGWSKITVRTILDNPRYTGRQVWNRQRRDEVLLDVEDVAAGHETKMRWNDRADWVWSAEQAHEAIISTEVFVRAQEQLAAGRNRPAAKKPRGDARAPYVLRGLLHCGICGKRMQGNRVRDIPRYRCRNDNGTAEHPRQLYVTEQPIVDAIDNWVAQVFDPKRIDETCAQLAAASAVGSEIDEARIDGARRDVADAEERLRKYQAALDSGADPSVVAVWISEAQGKKLAAQRVLADLSRSTLSEDEVRQIVKDLRHVRAALRKADPAQKAELYAALGLSITYRHTDQVAEVVAVPLGVDLRMCRRGDFDLTSTPTLRAELPLRLVTTDFLSRS